MTRIFNSFKGNVYSSHSTGEAHAAQRHGSHRNIQQQGLRDAPPIIITLTSHSDIILFSAIIIPRFPPLVTSSMY